MFDIQILTFWTMPTFNEIEEQLNHAQCLDTANNWGT